MQGRHADVLGIAARHTEHGGKRLGQRLKEDRDDGGHDQGGDDAPLDTLAHALPVSHAVVEGDDRDQRIADAEGGEQRELLDLVVDAEGALQKLRRGLCCSQNQVHAQHHDRKQRLHDGRRHADPVDIPDDARARPGIGNAAADLGIGKVVEGIAASREAVCPITVAQAAPATPMPQGKMNT